MLRRKLPTLLVALACGLATLPLTGGPAHADQPLPPPGQPVASQITTTSAVLTWTPPSGPVFRYSMMQLVNGQWQGYASMPSNTFTVAGLTPDTAYTFAVQAHALAGSGYTSSPLSTPVTFRTLPTQPWSCVVQIVRWPGTYAVLGTLTWHGTLPSPGWTVTFTIPLHLTINTNWNSNLTRTGTSGSITPMAWNTNLPPNGQTNFGFTGNFTGVWTPPSDFRINGVPCTITYG